MKYGYMPSFGVDLVSEIQFASKHFDFVEITYNPDETYGQSRVRGIKKALEGIHAIGHLHWGCDFSLASEKEIEKAIKQFGLFSSLGIESVTVHPSFRGSPWANIIENNVYSMTEIARFCKDTGITVNLENVEDASSLGLDGLRRLFGAFPDFHFTLDTGHAEITCGPNGYKKFLASFGQRLSHVHMHYSVSGMDHLPFPEKSKMAPIQEEIAKTSQSATVTLEIFYKLLNGKRASLDEEERKGIVLEHLRYLKHDQ